MMMQMLEAGGLSIFTDGTRAANDDNPRGFYESREVRSLPTDAAFLAEAKGRAVKVVSPLVRSLPATYAYRILFMDRALDEILMSQQRMLERAAVGDRSPSSPLGRELRAAFLSVLHRVDTFVQASSNIEALTISHRDAVENPMSVARAVSAFLVDFGLDPEDEAQLSRMASVVSLELHRSHI